MLILVWMFIIYSVISNLCQLQSQEKSIPMMTYYTSSGFKFPTALNPPFMKNQKVYPKKWYPKTKNDTTQDLIFTEVNTAHIEQKYEPAIQKWYNLVLHIKHKTIMPCSMIKNWYRALFNCFKKNGLNSENYNTFHF